MTRDNDVPTAAAPALIDWVWENYLGYFVSVNGHAYGPLSFNELRAFPRLLFRHLFDSGSDLHVALAASRKVNELKRAEWQRMLLRCPNWSLRCSRASTRFTQIPPPSGAASLA